MPVPELTGNKEIRLYPNPADSKFVVGGWLSAESPLNIEVIDLYGRRITEITVPEGKMEIEINTGQWRQSMYLLRIKNKQGAIKIEKLIII